MRRGTVLFLLFIILLAVGASFVVFWPNASSRPGGKPLYGINNPFIIKEGLDLQGGISVLLVPQPGQDTSSSVMQAARDQIEQRVNGGLGVNVPDGTALNPKDFAQSNGGTKPLFTGKDLDPNSLGVGQDPQTGAYVIEFAMKGDAIGRFSKFTGDHIGDFLTITLDGKVIQSATIQSQIPGNGQITGQFTLSQAQQIVNVLKYGALPVTFSIQSEQTVGPTLGQDSIDKSLIAGAIGLSIVILFMLLYYRLPGFLADIALILYSIFTFAAFKLIGVTLSLPGFVIIIL